jgi:hypothetical protein
MTQHVVTVLLLVFLLLLLIPYQNRFQVVLCMRTRKVSNVLVGLYVLVM